MLRRTFPQALAFAAVTIAVNAQTAGPRALIAKPVDEGRLVTLAGNTRAEANAKNDLGPVGNDMHLDMFLQLKRSPERELAAQEFVESLTDVGSPNFHQWISAAEYGRRFGAAEEDIATVSRWLESHGFRVNGVPAHNMVIDFSGTAGQARTAFHTEIHYLKARGKRHFANMSDPRIPEALLPAVTGVVSLSDIMPIPMLVLKGEYSVSANSFPLVPGDLATIYNLNPAFAAGYTGKGQTVVVVEDTDLYSGTADWNSFRNTFGLAAQFPAGTLAQSHPAPAAGGTACVDPGVNGDSIEAALDVEWAGAAAPDAAIVMAACSDTTVFGGFIALQNMLTNGAPLPSVVSISYGESETDSGASGNSYINVLYQTAAAAGVSVFVSAGDEDSAETDHRAQVAIHGVSVSSFASTPYNVAVGGTDFSDKPFGTTSMFWSTGNGTYFDSAKSYIPEIPWNESCAGAILSNFRGFPTPYGPSGYCNSTYNALSSVGGSGGPSGCSSGSPTLNGVVGGTCAGYAKPSWQSIFGNPGDGVRDLPDVSLFAASGLWGHYYVFCYSDGASCSGAPSTWYGGGGTSFASPIMAGIQAVINQALGMRNVGNPNPIYYKIGQSEYGSAATRTACNSGTGSASTCSFNDVTQGDNSVACAGLFNCYLGGGGLGILSTSNNSYAPAFAAVPGWDFATGIGTVNASNLLNSFVETVTPAGAPPAPVLATPANGATSVSLTPTLNWNVAPGSTSYGVSFGAASAPPLVKTTTAVNYAPGTLTPATTYYWSVLATNSLGTATSAVWSFTTSCVAALNPSSGTAPASGANGAIPIASASGCAWTAKSNVTWITIASGASGAGNGTVGYTVAPNTGAQRTGTIGIAGQLFTVTQGGIVPVISTLAGGQLPPTAATGTAISAPVTYGIAVDSAGNTYFASPYLNAVFKQDASGVVTRIAGTGVAGFSGDNGPALNAQLYLPEGVAVDSNGNVYVTDYDNYRVRKIDASGTITTVAGSGSCCGDTGDGGPATAAQIGLPLGLAVDAAGNLYISDISNEVVRKVDASGTISTVAGTGSYGFSGDGGPAAGAKLYGPYGLAVDATGNLYIADSFNSRIRMVSTSGTITTVAGNGTFGFSGDGGPATAARLDEPFGVAIGAAGEIYIADTYGQRIRKVVSTGTISTIAGTGVTGSAGDGGPATAAQFFNPYGLAVDAAGNLRIADSGNARIRQIGANGSMSTTVGGYTGDGGLGVFGYLNQPSGVLRDNAGNTYISDTNNQRVRKVAANGGITTIAGNGGSGSGGDGGPAVNAQIHSPQGLALDAAGNLYIADSLNYRVRKVDTSGNISTAAGNGICCTPTGDGGLATSARIGEPYGLAVDSSGNLYISDILNHVVRKVDASGNISTVAGIGSSGFSGDGGPATSARLYSPYSVASDAAGNLYIADRNNYRIRMVAPDGTISTVAGNGTCCFSGDGGPAAQCAARRSGRRGGGCLGRFIHRGHLQRSDTQGGGRRDHRHSGGHRRIRLLGRRWVGDGRGDAVPVRDLHRWGG